MANSLSFSCFLLGFSVSCAETARARQRTRDIQRDRGTDRGRGLGVGTKKGQFNFSCCLIRSIIIIPCLFVLTTNGLLLHRQFAYPCFILDLPLSLVSYLLFACDFTLQLLLNWALSIRYYFILVINY